MFLPSISVTVKKRLKWSLRLCGYNGAIKVSGIMDFKEVYYGPSFSVGTEIWSFLKNKYLNIELILPLRPSEFSSDYEELKDMGVEFKVPSIPIAFSLGYHFAF